MKSSEIAKLAGVSVRTLRHYHAIDLLPEPPRGENGYRDYGAGDLVRLLRIKRLSSLGFSLSRISEVLDEMDAHLHPLLTKHLVSLFNSVEFNPNGAQLIFTSHNTNLLDLDVLRRDQIWFTEKDEQTAATDLFSLYDFSIRKDAKVEKGYLIGRYGAIPFIKGGL